MCNAGRGVLGPLEAHSVDTVASVLDVNVVGLVRTLQAFLPDMKRRGSGRVLVTGSVGGLMGEPVAWGPWDGGRDLELGFVGALGRGCRRRPQLAASPLSPPRAALQ